jgi:hypothetical protein
MAFIPTIRKQIKKKHFYNVNKSSGNVYHSIYILERERDESLIRSSIRPQIS